MKFIMILSLGILISSAVQAKVVSSSLADGLDSDTPLDARLLPNRLTSVLATKTPLALASTQKGTVSKAYTIAPAFPTLTTTWYNTPRNYWVYTPYGYQADSNPNLLLVLDGHRLNKELALAQTLDHHVDPYPFCRFHLIGKVGS